MTTWRYREYHRDRIGWFFGATGAQLAVLAVAAMPVFFALRRGAWTAALVQLAVWALVAVVALVRVRGRSTLGWVWAVARFTVGRQAGWTRWRSNAAVGPVGDLTVPDLPGALGHLTIHETGTRDETQANAERGVGVVQHHPARVWAVSCRVAHGGIGMADGPTRDRFAAGLTGLLDAAARTELVAELQLIVRAGPDDGAERHTWASAQRRADAPDLVIQVNRDLHAWAASAAVRTDMFITVLVPEPRLARAAKPGGGGLDGRLRVLLGLSDELTTAVTGLGADRVEWLNADQLAATCRVGCHRDDRYHLIAAATTAENADGPTAAGNDADGSAVDIGVPWALAGPSRAIPSARSYRHDAWTSVSVALGLPDQGAVVGALAPLVTPGVAGEARSLLVGYAILPAQVADRRTANAEWAADLGEELRHRAQVKQRARGRAETAKARGIDHQLAAGHALTTAYAVATVTVPADWPVEEAGRRLDSSARRAGFPPLRLDLAHDVAFAASTLPLGLSLKRTR